MSGIDSAAPTSEQEVADIVKSAHARKAAIRVVGGGTRGAVGLPVKPALALSTARLGGVTLYDSGALTMIARAGTQVAEIERALAAEGQQLAFEPMDHRGLLATSGEPTIGGVVAANISGPRRPLAGACRDFVLGVRFVTGEGEIVKNGGRVMKNVTGLDLAKLSCGAYGVLGVLTEVALKVLPRPEAARTLVFEGLDAEVGCRLLRQALITPYEVSGAAWLPGAPSRTCLRIEGLESQVAHRSTMLAAAFAAHEATVIEGEAHDALWRAVRDVEAFHGQYAPVWRLSVKPTDAPAIVETLTGALSARCQVDWAGGLIWAMLPDEAASTELRGLVAPFAGHATLIRGGASHRAAVGVFQPEAPRVATLTRALRAQFDPAGVLNPGLTAA